VRATVFSFMYRCVRLVMTRATFLFQRMTCSNKDLETAVHKGDIALNRLYESPLKPLLFSFSKPSFQRDLFDLTFSSPLTFAAFKDDLTLIKLWASLGIGGGSFKTIMLESRPGNDRPRLQQVETDGTLGFLNALGLPGKGVDHLLGQVEHSGLLGSIPLGFSVGGNTADEYVETFLKIETWRQSQGLSQIYYELNISCPNTDHGRSLMDDHLALEQLVKKMRSQTDRGIVVKVSPDQKDQDLLTISELLKPIHFVAINAGNTQFRKRETFGFTVREFTREGGGFSGPALLPRTKAMIELLQPSGIPLIATGGVSSVQDVDYLLHKGAVLVGMASQLVKDPYSIPRIHQQLQLGKE